MPATQRKCIYGGLRLDVERHYIGSVTATTHQEKGIITLESNPSRGTVLPAPHGKGNKCDKNVKYKRTNENRNSDNAQAGSENQNLEEDVLLISDSDDEETVDTHIVIWKMVRKTITKRDGHSKTSREMEIMYIERLDPRNINFYGVAEDLLNEFPAKIQAFRQRSSTVTLTKVDEDDTEISV